MCTDRSRPYGPEVGSLRARHRGWLLAVLLLLGLLPVVSAAAAPGQGDPTFGQAGFVEHAAPQGNDRAMHVDALPDGRLVLLSAADAGTLVVTRLLPDGSRDESYGAGGSVEVTLATGSLTPHLDGARMVVGADGAVTLLAPATVGFTDLRLVSRRIDPTGVAGAIRSLDIDGMYLGLTALRGPAGDPVAVVNTYRYPDGHPTTFVVRTEPTLALDERVTGAGRLDGVVFAPSFLDGAGRWMTVELASEWEEGLGSQSVVVTSRRLPNGTTDSTYGVAGTARAPLPRPALSDGPPLAVSVDGDIVLAVPHGIARLDGLGRLRTELAGGGVSRHQLGDVRAVVRVGEDIVVVGGAGGRCVVAHRFTAALALVDGWGAGGRAEVCPRAGASALAGAVSTAAGVRILTTSWADIDDDDTVTLTAVGGDGTVDPGFGDDGFVHLRHGRQGATAGRSLQLLTDGGATIGVEVPDGIGVLRIDAEGAAVEGFGDDGYATTTVGAGDTTGAHATLQDGRTLVPSTTGVVAFTAGGTVDTAFGADGFMAVAGGATTVLELAGGRVLVLARDSAGSLRALAPDGATDTAFASGGTLAVPGFRAAAVARRGAGFVAVGSAPTGTQVRAFTAAGDPDPTFAGGAPVTLADAALADGTAPVVGVSPLGGVYVATSTWATVRIDALTATGQVDPAFTTPDVDAVNPDGWREIVALEVDSTGRLLLGRRGDPQRLHLERLLPTGAHDPTFGDAGVLELAAPGHGYADVVDLALDAQGRLTGLGQTRHGSNLVAFRLDPRVPAELPLVSVADAAFVERGPGQHDGRSVEVRLDRPSTVPVLVELELTAGSATMPDDLRAWETVPLAATVAPGQTTGYASLRITPDGDVEPDETFGVRISEAYQAVVADGSATVTIRDDDALRSLQAGDGFVRVGLGRPADEPAEQGDPEVAVWLVTATQRGVPRSYYLAAADLTTTSLDGLQNGEPADIVAVPYTAGGVALPDRTGTITPSRTAPLGPRRAASAPRALTLARGDGFLTARWAAPSDDGGEPVDAYFVVAQRADGSIAAIVARTGDARVASLPGLENGRSYRVSVAAITGRGFGAVAAATTTPLSTGPDPTAPGPPSYVLVSEAADGRSAVLTIGAPKDDGGSPVRSYRLYATQHARPVDQLDVDAHLPYARARNLDPEKPTTYLVAAVNSTATSSGFLFAQP